MSSRNEQMRQLSLKGKVMHKSGIGTLDAKIFDYSKMEDNSFIEPNTQILNLTVQSEELSKPSSSYNSLVLLPSENENFSTNGCYTELTPVPNVIIEDLTVIPENPLLKGTEEMLVISSDKLNSNQENAFSDSGSSFRPSNTDGQSDASSDDLPLASLINGKPPNKCDPLKPGAKRAKKGAADPLTWQVNKTKHQHMKGKKYVTYNKEKDGGKSRVERKSRQLGKRCESKKCQKSKTKRQCDLIGEEEIQELFRRFWADIDWKQRKTYVNVIVTQCKIKQKTTKNKTRRQTTFFYHLKIEEKLLPVCKKLFLSTLELGEWSVINWIKNSNAGIPNITEKYSKKIKLANEEKREEIRNFFEKLLKLPSHYWRASTSKLYLEPMFRSYFEVYEVYKKEVENPSGKDVFVAEMKKLNIDIFQPRKDQCDLCFSHNLGHVDDDTYNKHTEEKNKARKEKEKDKEDVIIQKSVTVFTVDVQAVQLVPQLQASMLYFKQNLACHNFTIYNVVTKAVICYVWHEGQGGMESNCFATCLIDFLDNELFKEAKNKPIIFYSDGCAARDRYALLSNVLLDYSIHTNTEIMQKYLVKGHSQMECDSVHSSIEARKKKRNIYSPSNYVQIIEDSRRHSKSGPYKVKYVDHTFFLNFSDLKYFNSIRPGKRTGDPCVTDIRALRYTKSDGIQYKLDFEDKWIPLPLRKMLLNDNKAHKNLYNNSLPISRDKYNNLQTLKSVIRSDYHYFYNSLSFFTLFSNN
ncbi:uncharacterized protein LOC126745457 [Anthonomus grandis grandis]|uniref:uncharacterized protein LOC126745457 n=1 Tax=Anthonomus grandis grandis TaxID=2921223 RepID=UPI0021663CF4|nr:uncharacterized protein LOC126745457 [Anthonomus grandis grandis]